MERRQKLLIAALAVMFVAYFGDQAYRRLYEQPLAAAEQSVASLESQLHEGKLEARRLQNQLPELDQLQQRSLPSNLEVAVTEYRSWLLQTIADSGLKQQSIDSTSPSRVRGLYDQFGFTLRGQGTLNQLTRFLHVFYGTDYLHKIRSINLSPTSAGAIDVTLTIEALALPSVAIADRLPEPRTKSGRLGLEELRVISQRNIFRQGDPPASQIKLSAITLDRQQRRQAWLSFETTGETRIASEGEAFQIDGTQLRVQAIRADGIEVDVDGRVNQVAIGQALD